MKLRLYNRPLQQDGLTLVELMVAMAISLFLLLGISYIYVNSTNTYRLQNAVAQTQENARVALERLARDIRMAGYWGCGSAQLEVNNQYIPPSTGSCASNATKQLVNTLNTASTNPFNIGRPIDGYDAQGSGWNPALPSGLSGIKSGTDVLILRGTEPTCADTNLTPTVKKHPGGNPPGSADIQLNGQSCLADGDIVMVTDCTSAAVFQISNVNVTGNVAHNTGTGTPGNSSKNLCKNYTGGELMRVFSRSYYLRLPAANETNNYCASNDQGNLVPALYRRDINGTETQLVCGVEDMQISYGIDSNADFATDTYQTANQVEANSAWGMVVSVQIQLTLASLNSNVAQAGNERRYRQVFTETIGVRNRLQ